jgi:hypothetical protein
MTPKVRSSTATADLLRNFSLKLFVRWRSRRPSSEEATRWISSETSFSLVWVSSGSRGVFSFLNRDGKLLFASMKMAIRRRDCANRLKYLERDTLLSARRRMLKRKNDWPMRYRIGPP